MPLDKFDGKAAVHLGEMFAVLEDSNCCRGKEDQTKEDKNDEVNCFLDESTN